MLTHLPIDIRRTQYKPIGKQLLIDYIRDTETEGGILIPETNSWYADVLAVADDCTEVKVNDRVLMSVYRGQNITFEDGTYTIVDEKDALGVVE